MNEFVHLHVHTEFSLLDGMCRIADVTKLAHRYGMRSLAITDHGTMAGIVKFYEEAVKNAVKPLIGSEFYIAPGSRFEKSRTYHEIKYHHITLFATNMQGYKNLIKLSTLSYLEGFYQRQRIDKELLAENCEGVLALSGCLQGEVSWFLAKDDMENAVKATGFYQDIFGKDNFYLEVMDNKLDEQNRVNKLMVELSQKTGAKIVATNDCHYLNKEDAFAHEVLLCIQTSSKIDDEKRMRFSSNEFYFKKPEEMAAAFKDLPESIKNTVEVSEKCNLELDLGQHHLPEFSSPSGKTPEAYLEELINRGLEQKFNIKEGISGQQESENEILKRAAYEFSVIKKMGFSGYFLIIQDFVNYAKSQKIMVGPGRGSAAGSLVAFLLGITTINPLEHKLIFERFLNPDRISLPDIDVDFCDRRRDEVISYIKTKYGEENVSQIGTYGRMAARAVIRDVGRALGFSYGEVDRLAKLISTELGVSLKNEVKKNPDIKQAIEKDESVKRLFDISLRLEGLNRHSSTHAAGLVITQKPVLEYVPLFCGSKNEVATQFEMDGVEKMGLLKVDILGLKTLAVIEDALALIKERKGIDIVDFPTDDPKTYQLLATGQSDGVFQLESKGMQELLKDVKPARFEDITDILALYRPGPMKSGMVKEYIARKNDADKIKYDHPSIESTLKDTYGVILYQEQVMEIANVLAGFTMGQADELRKAMGKKIEAAMDKQRQKFLDGAAGKNISKPLAEKIFEQISKFAGYGFNKSHSAGYALISYQTAYLKANYPLEYMTALLNSEMGNPAKIALYVEECYRMGIWILPPDVCESDEKFKIFSNDIIFGLSAIKNVGSGAIKSIVEGRVDGLYRSLFDFCERVNLRAVNKRVLESLIQAGAFDYLETYRSHLCALVDDAIAHGSKMQKVRAGGQLEIFSSNDAGYSFPVNKEIFDSLPEWPEVKLLSLEKDMLGVYLTGHPLQKYISLLNLYSTVPISQMDKLQVGSNVCVGGLLMEINRTTTKKGDRMGWGEIEDTGGKIKVMFYPQTYKEYSNLIRKSSILFIKGRLEKRDKLQIIADEVANLNTVKEAFNSEIELDVPLPLSEESMSGLKELFLNNKGNCPLYFNLIKDETKRVKVKVNGYSVCPDISFFEGVKDILTKQGYGKKSQN